MKTQTIKKCVAFSTAVVMLLGVAGCDKLGLGDKSADEITDVMSDYMDQIKDGKYSSAAKLLKDADSDALVAASEEMDADHLALLDAYIAATEYEIDDAEATKEDSGSLKITITVPDIEAALEAMDGSDVDALIDAMGDADTVEESFTVKFTYDDDWFIKDASKLEAFYIDNVEEVTLSSLSEEAALEYVNSAMDAIISGDIEAAYEYLQDEDDLPFDEYVAEEELGDAQLAVMSALFSSMTYTSEVTETGDDYVDVTVNMTLPDLEEVTSIAFDDDFIARVYAYFIWGGDDAATLLENDMAETFAAAIDSATGTTDGYMVVRVTADEEGNLDGETIDKTEDLFNLEIDGDSIISPDANQEDYIMPALEYALSSGLISQSEYDEFVAQLNGATPSVSGDGEPIEVLDQGDDFWRMYFYADEDFSTQVTEYHAGDAGIYFDAGTWDYYTDGEEMTIDVYYNGEFATTFTVGTALDYTDRAYASITLDDGTGIPAGEYVIDITGFDGEHYATVAINVAE